MVTPDDFLQACRKSSRAPRGSSSSRRAPSASTPWAGSTTPSACSRHRRARARARRSLRAARAGDAPRHPVHRAVGHRKVDDGPGALGRNGLPLIAVDGPQLFSKWLGESEKALRERVQESAPRRALPPVLRQRRRARAAARAPSASAGLYPRILSQLVREIDGLRDVKGVILLAATNRLERVDPALLRSGRFDYVVRCASPMRPRAPRSRGSAAAGRRLPPTSTSRSWSVRPRGGPAPTSRASAGRRRSWRLRNTSTAHATRPFDVHQRDFEAVLRRIG